MAKNTDSNLYTILFATGMVIVVGTLLAFLAGSLKEKIAENRRIEKQQNMPVAEFSWAMDNQNLSDVVQM